MLRMAVLAGLTASEALRVSPGLLHDMYELWMDSKGYRRDLPE